MDAVREAKLLGAEIREYSFGRDKPRYGWRSGYRTSADQYCVTFATAREAAAHFLHTREADTARKRLGLEV